MPKAVVIDDKKEARELLLAYLVKEQFEVLCAETAAQGIALVSTHKPDVVVLNMRLPDCTGIEVLTQIKEIHQEAKVVMLSGLLDDEMTSQCLGRGAACVFSKTMGLDKIVKEIVSFA